MLKNTIYLLIIVTSIVFLKKEFTTNQLIGKDSIELVGENYKLQKEVSDSFLLMKSAALKEGVDIKIISSYRSFEHQKRIWNNKYTKYTSNGLSPIQAINKIIEYSTIPGTSRHHWATDIDIIDVNSGIPKNILSLKNFEIGGSSYKLKKWLYKNANKYGFYLVYTNDENRKGFKYEPWHYSYKSISKPMLNEYRKIEIKKILKGEKILGSQYFTDEFLDKYIKENMLDINTELK